MDLLIEASPSYLEVFKEDIADISRNYLENRLNMCYGGLSSVSLIGLLNEAKHFLYYRVLSSVPDQYIKSSIEETGILSAWDLILLINFELSLCYKGIWLNRYAKLKVKMVAA